MYKFLISLSVIIFSFLFLSHIFHSAAAGVGPSVNLGSNPIISAAGKQTGNGTLALFTGDSNYELLVTDVVLTTRVPQGMLCNYQVLLKDGSGNTVGAFAVSENNWNNTSAGPIMVSFQGGLKVAAGENVTLEVDRYSYNGSNCDLYYSISAQRIHP